MPSVILPGPWRVALCQPDSPRAVEGGLYSQHDSHRAVEGGLYASVILPGLWRVVSMPA